MLDFVTKLVREHAELVVKINNLHEDIYNPNNEDDKVEFANKSIQLSAMKKYEEALRARIENNGVFFMNGQYFEKVALITPVIAVGTGTDTEQQENPSNENE